MCNCLLVIILPIMWTSQTFACASNRNTPYSVAGIPPPVKRPGGVWLGEVSDRSPTVSSSRL